MYVKFQLLQDTIVMQSFGGMSVEPLASTTPEIVDSLPEGVEKNTRVNIQELEQDEVSFDYYLDCGNATRTQIQSAIDKIMEKINGSDSSDDDAAEIMIVRHRRFLSEPSNPRFIPVVSALLKYLNSSAPNPTLFSPSSASSSGSPSSSRPGTSSSSSSSSEPNEPDNEDTLVIGLK